MRFVSITQYDEHSMILAKPVFDGKGRTLLGANQSIHPKYVERLKQLGISTLVVEDRISRGIVLEEMLEMPTWVDVMIAVKQAYEAVEGKKALPLALIFQGASKLLNEMQRRPFLLPMPSSLLVKELAPYAHTVNVALLSLQVGRALGYNQLQQKELAVGCLLHDIGKAVTMKEREHPEAGFAILRKERQLSLLSSHIAFQHHEYLNGQGYPRGISGKAFLEYAQICGLVNYFENLISSGGMVSNEAFEMVKVQSGINYSPEVVKAFTQSIPAYPPGSKVTLHNGETAIVTKINSNVQRPIVRLLSTDQELSLEDHMELFITGMQPASV